jgi:hypothetical protein
MVIGYNPVAREITRVITEDSIEGRHIYKRYIGDRKLKTYEVL